MVVWIARQMGCTPSQVLREPAWAIEAWLDVVAAEAEIQRAEARRGERR